VGQAVRINGRAVPAVQPLPPGMPGFKNARVYPFTPDVARATRLAGKRRRIAVLYTCNQSPCDQLAQTITTNLAAIGVDVQVYEQASRFARVGAGIQMMPNSMKVLRGIGLEDRLRRVAFAPRSHLNREWDSGEVSNELPMPEQRYGAPYLCMHRAELHANFDDHWAGGWDEAFPGGVPTPNRYGDLLPHMGELWISGPGSGPVDRR